MANEQELLRRPEREHSCTIHSMGDRWNTEDCLACAYEKGAVAQVAKLKAMGYEQVWEECPDCHNGQMPETGRGSDGFIRCETCKGTGKTTNKVKWDREKVAEVINKIPRDGCCYGGDVADQLYNKLTGEDNDK